MPAFNVILINIVVPLNAPPSYLRNLQPTVIFGQIAQQNHGSTDYVTAVI